MVPTSFRIPSSRLVKWPLLAVISCLCGSLDPAWVCGQRTNLAPEALAFFEDRVQQLAEATRRDLESVTLENWQEKQRQWRSELRSMLGFPQDLQRTEMHPTWVGSIELDGVSVDRLHYQSRPGLYVTANLYRPTGEPPEAGWPAVLYVCGHARVTDHGKLLGNKTNYQHHGLWLARHGVVCLTIDTTQLGEFHGEHHGTYKLGRWDWISQGFTPAGVETWNTIRGIDLLCALPYVDRKRIGITGRSGGGAYSWFAAALDDRIRVAVPVAGITDLEDHVLGGCVEGHCDCMYFENYFGWDYAKLAALLAPRALLLENSDSDSIFPLSGVLRIDAQLRDLYERLDASNNYGLVITPGPHQDTQELRVPAFRWLLKHLTDQDVSVDQPAKKEIEPSQLAVFVHELPADQQVDSVGANFAPVASKSQDVQGDWQSVWLPKLVDRGVLRMPQDVEFVEWLHSDLQQGVASLLREAEADSLHILQWSPDSGNSAEDESPPLLHLWLSEDRIHPQMTVSELDALMDSPSIRQRIESFPGRRHYFVRWRGAAWHSGGWSQGNASVKARNQLVRRFYLLGQTPEQQALADFLASLKWIAENNQRAVELAGTGREALLICLAAALASDWSLVDVRAIHLDAYPTDAQLAACLPGVLQIFRLDDLKQLVTSRYSVHNTELAPLSTELLVDSAPEPQQATGMRIVEVGPQQATLWVRATRWPLANLADLPEVKFSISDGKRSSGVILPESGVAGLRFAVPGVAAEVRAGIRQTGTSTYRFSEWQAVDESSDYSALIPITDLEPATAYEVRTEARAPQARNPSSTLSGSFKTLPATDSPANFKLAVATCQGFVDRDGPHGFDMYRTILARKTDAFVMAGDVVYYDRLARSKELAEYHWQRTYSLPTLIEFHRRVPSFFLKDDHDTYVDDSWPGNRQDWTDDFSFELGQQIFAQQTGLPQPAYRTIRVGPELQLWLMEGRDFRSPNTASDGPQKTIWGEQQKVWLKHSLEASTAEFKVVISPTPLVGPDRENKRDNHSNRAFQTEGSQIRKLLAAHPNTVSVCGDRHWQYHSIDPETGLHEFSVGPASDRHAGGWKQENFDPAVHQFLRVDGGYLEIELAGTAEARRLLLKHLDTLGNEWHRHVLHAAGSEKPLATPVTLQE
ncbi:MAG: alkaline phosphatase D family protein [bacterium]|nr:alkaline phosphatase D family protein [bacterium]